MPGPSSACFIVRCPSIRRNTDTDTITTIVNPNFIAVYGNVYSATPGALLTGIQFGTGGPDYSAEVGLAIGTAPLSANVSGGFVWGSTAFTASAQTDPIRFQFVDLGPVILPAG